MLLEGQRLLARLEDVLLGGLDQLDGPLEPAVGLGLGVGVVHGVVGIDHGLQPDLLDLGAELGLHLLGILPRQARGHVEDLGLAQVMDRPEGPDRHRQLLAVGGEDASNSSPSGRFWSCP